MVIADNLAVYVDNVYQHPASSTGNMVIVAVALFAIQIYCDFSGYSDIAIGSARIMGFDLMQNFNYPFSSKSISEFWRRWHISLSTWFFDYIFNPITISLRYWGKASVVVGLLVTFFVAGIWHGAGWTFIIYGMLHGFAMVYEYYTKKARKKIFGVLPVWLNSMFSKIFTFSFVAFSWIFFRSGSVGSALYMIRHLSFSATNLVKDLADLSQRVHGYSPQRPAMILVLLAAAVFALIEFLVRNKYKIVSVFTWPKPVRWIVYYGVILGIMLFGVYDVTPNFIYFQF